MGTADTEGRLAKGKEAKKTEPKTKEAKGRAAKRARLEWVPLWHPPQRRADSLGKPLQNFVLNFELDFFIIFNCLFIDGASNRLSEGSNIW